MRFSLLTLLVGLLAFSSAFWMTARPTPTLQTCPAPAKEAPAALFTMNLADDGLDNPMIAEDDKIMPAVCDLTT